MPISESACRAPLLNAFIRGMRAIRSSAAILDKSKRLISAPKLLCNRGEYHYRDETDNEPDKNLPAAARKFSPTPSVFGHAVENYDASPKCFRAAFAAGLAAFVVAAQPCLALGLLAELSLHPSVSCAA